MTRIDDQIREALSEDDRKLLDQFGDEPGMFELIGASFRSKMRAWVVLTYVMTFVFLGLGVWFFVEIINAETSLAAACTPETGWWTKRRTPVSVSGLDDT